MHGSSPRKKKSIQFTSDIFQSCVLFVFVFSEFSFYFILLISLKHLVTPLLIRFTAIKLVPPFTVPNTVKACP